MLISLKASTRPGRIPQTTASCSVALWAREYFPSLKRVSSITVSGSQNNLRFHMHGKMLGFTSRFTSFLRFSALVVLGLLA